jgi:hypothetical protein
MEGVVTHWMTIFEDRYGYGSYERLLGMFDRPCMTFAEIAGHFGVSRERVRQWHRELRPDAPRGHARKRLCVVYHQKRRLLEDPLFRSFYEHARPHVEPGRIALIPTREGFRRRAVQLDGATVALKRARQSAVPAREDGMRSYILTNCHRQVDYIYYRLSPDEYLLVPTRALPADRTTFLDTPALEISTVQEHVRGHLRRRSIHSTGFLTITYMDRLRLIVQRLTYSL